MNSRIARYMAWCSLGTAATVLLAALGVLVGYAERTAALPSHLLLAMSPLTACGLAGIALAILTGRWLRGWLALALSWAVIVLGLVTCMVHVINGSDTLSPLFGAAVFGVAPETTGRVPISTALCLLLLGGAQLRRLAGWVRHADVLSSVALAMSGIALLGYMYGVRELFALYWFNHMALRTAIALFALALATMGIQVERGVGVAATLASSRAGGAPTRLLLAFALLPTVIGWILLRAIGSHLMGDGVAIALLVVLTIGPLLALGLRQGRILDALDAERQGKVRLQLQLSSDLQRRLAEQAIALEHESAERAKAEQVLQRAQRMEAVGQLTGGIAHDFNNLLMAISGNIQLLQHVLPADHPARRFADKAATAVGKGAKLTGQLLAFSRTQHLNIRALAIEPILIAARELVGNALGPRIAVELDLQADGAWVSTDDDQLQFAILNLALNARDAMPQGGTFRIAASRSSRNDADGQTQACVTLCISDTGAGMSADVVARAGEPFFTTKEHGKGSGLGLAQVYGVVRQCGGDLHIRSAVGQGTTIEILLPCVTPVAEVATASARPSRLQAMAPAHAQPLLLIDDDAEVREVFAQLLKNVGYSVLEAADGDSGLRQLDVARPALAIIDFLMPGLNGAEVARLAQQRQPELPVIFISGYSDTVALDGIPGATVLRKPIKAEALLSAVARVLDRHPAE